MVHIRRIDEMYSFGGDTIRIGDFEKIIGWNASNVPMDEKSLRLEDGTRVAYNRGVRINGKEGYTVCYRYDIIKGVIFFPIVFAKDNRRYTASDVKSIENFVETGILNEPFLIKNEIMKGSDYKRIRNHEIMFNDRLPFTELYDWNTDSFYGYSYIEIGI